MEYYIYIIIILLLIIILTIIYIYSNKETNDTKIKFSNTPPSSRIYTPIIPMYKQVDLDNNVQLGNLFYSCPCSNQLECKNGICKKKLNSDCILHRECGSGYCVLGKCMNKKDDNNQICLHNQLMKFNIKTNKFEFYNEQIKNIRFIYIDIYDNEYYITDNGIFDEFNKQIFIHIDIDIIKIINYMDNMLVLTSDGILYKCIIDDEDNWKFNIINSLYDYDFRDIEILDINVINNDILLNIKYIHGNSELLYYIDKIWHHNDKLKNIFYNKWENRVEVYQDKTLFYKKNQIIDKLIHNIKYRDIIYVRGTLYLSNNESIYKYIPNGNSIIPYYIENIKNIKLFNTNNDIWIVLDNFCIKK